MMPTLTHSATITEFDRLVSAMTALHVPRPKAEAAARAQLGITGSGADVDPAQCERDGSIAEKAEQLAIVKLFREHGCTVRSTSQARPSKIAIGFPDLFVTHRTLPLAFFWETKRQVGGVVSDAQKDFGADCWRCGVRWYTGDRHDAQRLLDEQHIPRTL